MELLADEDINCHHCGAEPGEAHRVWDDIARCYISGQQLISCEEYWLFDDDDNEYPNPDHRCHPSIWDGDWPGVKQCQRYGLINDPWSFWGATEDLNTLNSAGKWDIETQQHIISPETLARIIKV